MKYVVLLCDGAADEPIASLGGKTPLEYAKTPNMDRLATLGRLGRMETTAPGLHAGSDTNNLNVMGFNPNAVYTGRSPLEAASIGVEMADGDVSFRCNLVTLEGDGDRAVMADYSGHDIKTEHGRIIMKALDARLGSEDFTFYPGVSYRNLLLWRGGASKMRGIRTTAPHDISDREIGDYLPTGPGSDALRHFMKESRKIIAELVASEIPDCKATSAWFWGEGTRPNMPAFRDRTGLKGAVVSAVDLVKGIGRFAGMDVIEVPGATGWIDTNYEGKAAAGIHALEDHDYVFLHVEATDEAGHKGSAEQKVLACEYFDRRIVAPVLEALERRGDYRVLLTCDHPTPVATKTHTKDAVPFVYFDSSHPRAAGPRGFSEREAMESGVYYDNCRTLVGEFLGKALD
ncbi:MAG: cofactor-independent phosphoglycerate mutase [Myxococcales bacterium]|nr:cofactor-independent phosphoglycerate mutase [Myxococcales bacterium]